MSLCEAAPPSIFGRRKRGHLLLLEAIADADTSALNAGSDGLLRNMHGRPRAWAACLLLASSVAEFTAPGTHHAPSPGMHHAPAEAPTHRNLVDLAPLPAKQFALGFSNPFRQYDGGAIPGWHYGGDAMLFNDYLSLTPAAPSRIGWVWATEAVEMPSWEVRLASYSHVCCRAAAAASPLTRAVLC